MTNTGTLPSKGEQSTPDGSSTRPFVVVVEFSITLTSTVPATGVRRIGAPVTKLFTSHPASRALGVAPRNVGNVTPEIKLTWLRGGVEQAYPFASARARSAASRSACGACRRTEQPQDPEGRDDRGANEARPRLRCGAVRRRSRSRTPGRSASGGRRPSPRKAADRDLRARSRRGDGARAAGERTLRSPPQAAFSARARRRPGSLQCAASARRRRAPAR
jgi:hypothetical protein